jgi:hypothetical protein
MLFKEFEISLLTNQEGGGCNLSRLGPPKYRIYINTLIHHRYVLKQYPIFYIYKINKDLRYGGDTL